MRCRRFRVNYEVLRNLLGLPPEAKILRVEDNWDGGTECFWVYLEHPSFEEIKQGMVVLEMSPTFAQQEGIGPHLLDWGIKKE